MHNGNGCGDLLPLVANHEASLSDYLAYCGALLGAQSAPNTVRLAMPFLTALPSCHSIDEILIRDNYVFHS